MVLVKLLLHINAMKQVWRVSSDLFAFVQACYVCGSGCRHYKPLNVPQWSPHFNNKGEDRGTSKGSLVSCKGLAGFKPNLTAQWWRWSSRSSLLIPAPGNKDRVNTLFPPPDDCTFKRLRLVWFLSLLVPGGWGGRCRGPSGWQRVGGAAAQPGLGARAGAMPHYNCNYLFFSFFKGPRLHLWQARSD